MVSLPGPSIPTQIQIFLGSIWLCFPEQSLKRKKNLSKFGQKADSCYRDSLVSHPLLPAAGKAKEKAIKVLQGGFNQAFFPNLCLKEVNDCVQ